MHKENTKQNQSSQLAYKQHIISWICQLQCSKVLEDRVFFITMGAKKRKYIKWKMNAPISMKTKGKKIF